MRWIQLGLLLGSLSVFGEETQLADDAAPLEFEQVPSNEAFDRHLAPYGDWVLIDGVRAFRPSVGLVGGDFVPYASHGRWISTEAGWSFSSTLPFGWATFHYGRWWLDPTWGWVWLPDTTWGPAWVDWRFGGGYAGWAPLAPGRFSGLHSPRWFFVEAPYFGSPHLFRYSVPRARIDLVFSSSSPVPTRTWHGATWYAGPSYRDVVHVAVEPPQRRSMREFAPPQGIHQAAPLPGGIAPPPPQQPQRGPPPPPGRMTPPPPPRNDGVPPPPQQLNSPPPPRNVFVPPPPQQRNLAPPPPQQRNMVPPPPQQRNLAPPSPQRMAPAAPPRNLMAPPSRGFVPPPPSSGQPPPPTRRQNPPAPGPSNGNRRGPPPPGR